MIRNFKTLATTLLDAVYPPACLLCDIPLSEGLRKYMLCDACIQALIHDPLPSCPRCSSSVGIGIDVSSGCVRCDNSSFAFASSFRVGPYDAKLRDAILRMKYSNGESLAETLGQLWVDDHLTKFQALKPHVVIPIPLHFWRRWQRGYNQAASLARVIASTLKLPMHSHWLRRIRNTPIQATQSAAARRENVKGAFKMSRFASIKEKRVLLIDDVLTTGATAHEAAKVLRDAGAEQIDVAILAHR